MDNSSSAPFYHQTAWSIQHEYEYLPVDDDVTDDELGASVQLRFFRVVSEEGFEEEVGRRHIHVYLPGLLTMEETPVVEFRRALTELGAAAESHATIIVDLFDYIHREFVEGDLDAALMVNIFEEVAGHRPVENHQQLELDDDEFVLQVARLRQTARFDMAVSRSMEVDATNIVRTTPASQEAIARLEKVRQGEGADLHCVICMGDEEDGQKEEFKRLPCAHLFHSKCVVPWLRTNASCPLCRHQLPS